VPLISIAQVVAYDERRREGIVPQYPRGIFRVLHNKETAIILRYQLLAIGTQKRLNARTIGTGKPIYGVSLGERYAEERVFARVRSNSDAFRIESVGWTGFVMHSENRSNASRFIEKTADVSLTDFFAGALFTCIRDEGCGALRRVVAMGFAVRERVIKLLLSPDR
jgi:hypothetical protein